MRVHKFCSLLAMTLCSLLVLSACGPKHYNREQDDVQPFRIGIIQFAGHEALNQTYQGVVNSLARKGLVNGVDVLIEQKNANGDMAACEAIADEFVSEKKDVIVAISTPAAQVVATHTKDIPIVAAAVTDPVGAGLAASAERPGGNVTGVSDLQPMQRQINLLREVIPNVKTIAVVRSKEQSAVFQAKKLKEAAAAFNMRTTDVEISSVSDMKSSLAQILPTVDAVYATADSVVSSNIPALAQVCGYAKRPVLCSESFQVKNGGLMTYSIDYGVVGEKAGMQVARILKEKAKAGEMPLEYISEYDSTLSLNQTTALSLGLILPEHILEQLPKD